MSDGTGRTSFDERRLRSPLRVGRLVAYGITAVVVTLMVSFVLGWRPSLPDVFGSKTVDRSPPAVLRSLEDLHEYRASSAHFEVVVDVQKDAKFLPDAIRGTRTLFVGVGNVDASVDFSRLGSGAVTRTGDKAVRIALPHAVLSEPVVDVKHSYVVSRQRGLLDRVGGFFSGNPDSDRQMYSLAADKMVNAAKADPTIKKRAEDNTALMLKGFLGSLGFNSVTVVFDDRQAAADAKNNR